MTAIPNATPIQPLLADKWWVKTMSITPTSVNMRLLAWDGTYTIGLPVAKRVALSSELQAAIDAEVLRLSNIATAYKYVGISAPDPSLPVVLTVRFVDNTSFVIPDLFARYATDEDFAELYDALTAYIGGVI
jgi:hypothetical protein